MGGSKDQAEKVYSYLQEIIHDDPNIRLVKDMQSKTIKYSGISPSGKPRMNGPFISVLAASQKQARGAHPHRDRGGVLVLDEEAEMDPDIVSAAIPQMANAKPSVIVRPSTFHKAFGTFQQVWDNAEAMGYSRYSWDCFDVCEPCEYDCAYCIPEFREEYCKGRAKNGEGWLLIDEIKQGWRDKITVEDFEIEWLASKPSSKNLVIPPHLSEGSVRAVTFDPQNPDVGDGFDHGYATEACGVTVQNEGGFDNPGGVKKVIDVRFYSNVPIDVKTQAEKEATRRYASKILNADSTGQGKDLNAYMRRAGMTVRDIDFGKLKTVMIENKLWHMTRGLIWIDPKFVKAITQLKNWNRTKKHDDHFPDALGCALLKWNMIASLGRTSTKSFKVGKGRRITSRQEW